MATSAPGITPKQPLLVPKKVSGIAPKAMAPSIKAKTAILSKTASPVPKKAVMAASKANVTPSKAPLVVPKIAPKPTVNIPTTTSPSLAPQVRRQTESSAVESLNPSVPSLQSDEMEKPATRRFPTKHANFMGSQSSSYVNSPSILQKDLGTSGVKGLSNLALHRVGSTGKRRESLTSVDINTGLNRLITEVPIGKISDTKLPEESKELDNAGAVGASPWLEIERRINEIRALVSAHEYNVSPSSPRDKKEDVGSIYGNYATRYESGREWHKENPHALSYGMVQNLHNQRMQKNDKNLGPSRDRWNFVDGFLKPRRKPFASMSELSRHFSKINPNDQSQMLKLLLACRSLEKVIEEQHNVLDMLDHDLREAREMLKLPENLRGISTQKLLGTAPQEEPFYPTSDIPLFIRGRVSLLPGPNDIQLSVVNNG
ncbi:uncharacterized protein BXIN_2893 [Babesia sp. Xinjiang]|uniref:uncharacterized protein n=1 Tax=Babesia sp. Xinjiang TaxID=462227 RepID=UPI000A22F6E9|nr:uncharacterized protein BXIN_2893 [Babesia sp. Xinjiang]ORM39495.1 hypothetical protein BXIN_2893 [Babesia sp. Xinjiang]